MSFCTFGVAVAVTAMKGTPGRLSLSLPSCLNCSAGHPSSWSCRQGGPPEACMQRQCRDTPSNGHACKLGHARSRQRTSEACLAADPSERDKGPKRL